MSSDGDSNSAREATRPLWPWVIICLLLVATMGYLRLFVFDDRIVPLTYGLPLLVCLIPRSVRLMYGMAIVFTVLATYKVFYAMEEIETGYQWLAGAMMAMNIWTVAGTVHGIIVLLNRLEEKNQDLEVANAELQARNEELAAREEEIAQQNEELQTQTEELEQQAEELRQQTEEMEHQAAELQASNEELTRREEGLQTLLNSARWIRPDLPDEEVLTSICEAAEKIMDEGAVAAAVVQEQDGRLVVRGHHGLGPDILATEGPEYSRTFAALIAERKQTAYVYDLETRPDLAVPQPSDGPAYRSILASPVWIDGKVVAVLKVYANQPREWSENDFRVAEWLAAQSSLALQAFRYQREVELKRREAEEASIQKTRFLAAVSHDVRTPANAISLLADLIEQSAGDPEAAEEIPLLVRDLKSSARGLIDLVSDVLDLAKFDVGKLDLQVSDFPVSDILDHELRQSLKAAQAKGLELTIECPSDAVWLRTDRTKLARVLSNLVGNAIKFTDTGRVHIECLRRENGGADIRVHDTGVGISSEHLHSIFDEFFQLRNPERDRNKGTGLGLAICRRLVDGLGCSISVTSTLGEGTVCTLSMPPELVIPAPAEPAKKPAAVAISDPVDRPLEGRRVLLVEDHETTRAAIARLLASQGAIVLQAATCRAALQMLRTEHPQVLLLDLMLPDEDGTTVLRSIQKHRPASLQVVLAVSGDVREARVAEVRQLGADALVSKPLTIESLMGVLRQYLPGRRPLSGDRHQPSPR